MASQLALLSACSLAATCCSCCYRLKLQLPSPQIADVRGGRTGDEKWEEICRRGRRSESYLPKGKKGFLVSVGVRKILQQSDNASHQCSQPDFRQNLSLSLSHSSQRQRLVEMFPSSRLDGYSKKPQNEIVNVGRKAAGAGGRGRRQKRIENSSAHNDSYSSQHEKGIEDEEDEADFL
jgi:hypothetical protein